MAAVRRLRRRVRGTRPQDERGQVDRHACRSHLRLELPAARPRGSLCVRGLEGEVCEGLRGGMDQGDESGPLRCRLNLATTSSRGAEGYSELHVGWSGCDIPHELTGVPDTQTKR